MDCSHWKEMIIDRLADELNEEDSILLEQHLAECEACRREEQMVACLFESACPTEEWHIDVRMEDALIGEMGRPRDGEPSAPGLWNALVAAVRRPLPSYAVMVTLFVSSLGGFWLGRTGPVAADRLEWGSSAHPVQPASRPLARLEGKATFAVADTEHWAGELGFVPVTSDVISLYGAIPPDSL